MLLNVLPLELLLELPSFLDSIEDLLALSSTSRTLYRTCANPRPKVLSKLAAHSGRIFFRPHPHILIAATARQVADWAVQHNQCRFHLEEAIRGGVDKLLELAIEVAGLTMEDIRSLWRFKYEVLNPLDKELDLSAGPATGNLWTLCNDPATTLVSWVIYGELFHHSTELAYLPIDTLRHRPQPLSSITRYKWFAYCMPDVNSFRYLKFDEQPQFFKEYNQKEDDRFQQLSMQTAFKDYIDYSGWEEELEETAVYEAMDPVIRPVFVHCAMHLGFRALELLVPGGTERLNGDLERLAANLADALKVDSETETATDLIQARNNELRRFVKDRWWLSGFQTLEDDLNFTLWSYWKGEHDEQELMQAIRSPAKRTIE
ncbi:hypothetical protein C8F01DRAFT_1246171 [Mycena amicta]|nr:hypothetical protein C8F01DRAFT_1246171 [Mycena amicta]